MSFTYFLDRTLNALGKVIIFNMCSSPGVNLDPFWPLQWTWPEGVNTLFSGEEPVGLTEGLTPLTPMGHHHPRGQHTNLAPRGDIENRPQQTPIALMVSLHIQGTSLQTSSGNELYNFQI
jgi:hypothetical protein